MKRIYLLISVLLLLIASLPVIVPYVYLSGEREFQEISIQGEGFQLHGVISEGLDPRGPWIILVHGNRKSGQDHALYENIRENLPADFSILAIDLRGFGDSTGEGDNQFPESINRIADLKTAGNFLSDKYGIQTNQIMLIGHSFGAAQVLHAAQDEAYMLVVPVGLGDWDALLDSDSSIEGYQQKFEANTGIKVDKSELIMNARNFSVASLFKDCPESPVWFVYAGQDDAIPVHREPFNSLSDICPGMVHWREIPFSDHMYGTEMERLPELLRGIYSRLSQSLLIFNLNQILNSTR